MRKILLAIFLCSNAFAAQYNGTPGTTHQSIQMADILPPSLFGSEFSIVGDQEAGSVEWGVLLSTNGNAYYVRSITSNLLATARLGRSNVFGFPQVSGESPNTIALQYNGNSQPGTVDKLQFEWVQFSQNHPFQRPVIGFGELTINVVDTLAAPVVSLSSSATSVVEGQVVTFTATCNQAAVFSYDYGDGTTGASSQKSWDAPGVYTVKVAAATINGDASASALITVYSSTSKPFARFNSDPVGGVKTPMLFDGAPSTDLENKIVAYSWDFGDGTETGSGVILSHDYVVAGTYTVTLTVTDGQGLTGTASRDVEVLSEQDFSGFNTEIEFEARYNTTPNSRDSLTLFARVNVGDELNVGVGGKEVSVDIAGKQFSGTANKRGISKSSGVTFKLKGRIPKQPSGTADLRLVCRAQSGLGTAIEAIVAQNEDDVPVPVTITIGSKVFVVNVSTEREGAGQRGRAKGVYE